MTQLEKRVICVKIYEYKPTKQKQTTLKDILFYVEAIFKEKHSFKNNSEGLKKIRKTLEQRLTEKNNIEKDILNLKNQITDFKKLQ